MRQLCVTIGLALMPTLMLPGLVRLQVPTTGALFLQQAWLVALMEEQLFVGCAPPLRCAALCAAAPLRGLTEQARVQRGG